MRLIRLGVAAAGLLVIAPLSLFACSSSSKTGSTTTTTNRAHTIRIGLEGPMTGSQKETGIGMLDGARMAAARLNAHGGILGRRGRNGPTHDQGDPGGARQAAPAAAATGLRRGGGP